MSEQQYDVHPSLAMARTILQNLPQKTGRDLESWMKLVREQGPPTKKERLAWLKSEHGLGLNYATWIASQASDEEAETADPEVYLRRAHGYVESLYAGPKAALRPIHDALLTLARRLGSDIRICPCQTMVPIYREHVIAQIKPTTRTRIDFGLALGDTPASGKLIDTGGFAQKDRITHRIAVSSLEEIDGELKQWLQVAYDRHK